MIVLHQATRVTHLVHDVVTRRYRRRSRCTGTAGRRGCDADRADLNAQAAVDAITQADID